MVEQGLCLRGERASDSAPADNTSEEKLSYRGALQAALAGLPSPALIDVDIGHVPPQFTLLNGALAEVSWSAAQGGLLRQTLA